MDLLELLHGDDREEHKMFPCGHDGCEKSFGRRSDLVRHERIHTNIRPYHCTEPGCNKSFVQNSALKVHKRVHSGERPHACDAPKCGKTFGDSSSLARHRRIHTGHRPYLCGLTSCKKSFCRRVTMIKHMKRVHPGEPIPKPSHMARSAEDIASDLSSAASEAASSTPPPSRPKRNVRRRRTYSPSPSPSSSDWSEAESSEGERMVEDEPAPAPSPPKSSSSMQVSPVDNEQSFRLPSGIGLTLFRTPPRAETAAFTHTTVPDFDGPPSTPAFQLARSGGGGGSAPASSVEPESPDDRALSSSPMMRAVSELPSLGDLNLRNGEMGKRATGLPDPFASYLTPETPRMVSFLPSLDRMVAPSPRASGFFAPEPSFSYPTPTATGMRRYGSLGWANPNSLDSSPYVALTPTAANCRDSLMPGVLPSPLRSSIRAEYGLPLTPSPMRAEFGYGALSPITPTSSWMPRARSSSTAAPRNIRSTSESESVLSTAISSLPPLGNQQPYFSLSEAWPRRRFMRTGSS